MYLAAPDFRLFVYFSVAAGCRVHHLTPYPTSLKAGEAGEFATHTSFTPLRLSAESSSRPLTPSPLCEGGEDACAPG